MATEMTLPQRLALVALSSASLLWLAAIALDYGRRSAFTGSFLAGALILWAVWFASVDGD